MKKYLRAFPKLLLWLRGCLPEVPLRVKHYRVATCFACDEYQDGHCGNCGCNLEIKCGIASEACPLKKWDRTRLD